MIIGQWLQSHSFISGAFAAGFVALLPFLTVQVKLALTIGAVISSVGLSAQYQSLDLLCALVAGCLTALPILWAVSMAGALGDIIESSRGMTLGLLVDPSLDMPEQALTHLLRLAAMAVSLERFGTVDVARLGDLSTLLELSAVFLSLFAVIEILFMGIGRLMPLITFQSQLFTLKAVLGLGLLWMALPALLGQLGR